MNAFNQHTGIVAPLIIDNVDTDQIIPSREMKRVSKLGLGEGLFAGWRYEYDGMQKIGTIDAFVLNQERFEGASILLGGKNWGCGSSREHAVWALYDFGIRAIVAESFGRIFYRNCARNGVLAIELNAAEIEKLLAYTDQDPQTNTLLIDLPKSQLSLANGDIFDFSIPASDHHMLVNGLDPIEYTLRHSKAIDAFSKKDRVERPWAYL